MCPTFLEVLTFDIYLISYILFSCMQTVLHMLTEISNNVLREQNHRCAIIYQDIKRSDYHHKNGGKSDSKELNCQALCRIVMQI